MRWGESRVTAAHNWNKGACVHHHGLGLRVLEGTTVSSGRPGGTHQCQAQETHEKRVGLAGCQLYCPGKEMGVSSSRKGAVGVLTLTRGPHPLCLGRVLYVTVVSGVLSVSSTLGGASLVTPPWALHFPNSAYRYLGRSNYKSICHIFQFSAGSTSGAGMSHPLAILSKRREVVIQYLQACRPFERCGRCRGLGHGRPSFSPGCPRLTV